MSIPDQQGPDDEVEAVILAVLNNHSRLTFTSLADALPTYRWNQLFRALHRLHERRQIELATLPWDYEVVLRNPAGRVEGNNTPRLRT